MEMKNYVENFYNLLWNDNIETITIIFSDKLQYTFKFLDVMNEIFGFANVVNLNMTDYPNSITMTTTGICSDYFYDGIDEYEKEVKKRLEEI